MLATTLLLLVVVIALSALGAYAAMWALNVLIPAFPDPSFTVFVAVWIVLGTITGLLRRK